MLGTTRWDVENHTLGCWEPHVRLLLVLAAAHLRRTGRLRNVKRGATHLERKRDEQALSMAVVRVQPKRQGQGGVRANACQCEPTLVRPEGFAKMGHLSATAVVVFGLVHSGGKDTVMTGGC